MRSNLLRRWVPGAMLLVAAGASSALTLGRSQGVALIGRPLDMGIQMTLDAPNDVSDLCAEAEVFYGDNRVEARRVDLGTTASGTSATLRVRVSSPVDEAFVQVYLRVGCGAKFTRRYVLLSEQPGDVAEAAAVPTPVAPQAAQAVPAGVAPRPAAAVAGADAPAATRPPARAAAVVAAAAPLAPDAAPAARPAPAKPVPRAPAAAAVASAPAPSERPRLKLDTLEVRPQASAAAPATRAASAATPAASVATAAETASAAEDLERNAQRVQALEADLRKLREGMLRSDAALIELRARLEKAEGERYANGLVYALAGLLAAALAAALVVWRRSRNAAQPAHWWDDSHQPDPDSLVAVPEEALYEESQLPVAPAPRAAVAPAAVPVAAAPQVPAAPAPAAAGDQDRPVGRPVAPAGAVTGFGFLSSNMPPRLGALTEADGLRVTDPAPLSSDELSDIQQEADFFVSLGEYDRAIEILRNHIEAHPQASAVAWLDLLEIHHKLGQKDEYEQLRRDFEWLFNAKAPAFEEFHESRQGLEQHPRLMARIQSAWPRREVLDMIDEAIFRRPGTEGDEPLNLEGYRDLLFLHTLAAELSAHEPAAVPAPPPVAAVAAPMQHEAVDLSTLDIDLDELLRAEGFESAPAAPAQDADGLPGDRHIMDFDLDLESSFKLPNQRQPKD